MADDEDVETKRYLLVDKETFFNDVYEGMKKWARYLNPDAEKLFDDPLFRERSYKEFEERLSRERTW